MDLHLFRLRRIWVPTIWGWLVLLLLAAGVSSIAARHIHAFLSPNDPAPGATVLVVEGWLADDELDEAIAVFRTGRYEFLITTGGPVDKRLESLGIRTYAEWSARYLTTRGLTNSQVRAVSAPASAQDRTFLSAVMVREFLTRQRLPVDAIDLFSAGTHGRRSRTLYRMAFGPGIQVGVFSAKQQTYAAQHWWRTSAGTSAVAGETMRLIWTACCFYPPPAGSHEERWGKGRER